MENPLKTEGGELISTYNCAPETIEAEFLLAKQQYNSLTGRAQGKRDIVAYHARQSFKPGEITPAEANRIGYELASRFTKGRHAFAVYTHTDRQHVHNHILWNSTTLDCQKKFRDFFRSGRALRRCSDILCAENGLSVIENPQPGHGKHYGEWLGDSKKPSFHDRLRRAIDEALARGPASFEDFIASIEAAGVEVSRRGQALRFRLPEQKQHTRCDTLRGDYTEEAIRERIVGRRVVSAPAGRNFKPIASSGPGLLIDIETKMRAGKGPGFEKWAKVQNLKSMARTLIYLQEHGLDDYAVLKEKSAAASARVTNLSDRIKELDAKLTANASLQKHIINYSKTRQTYIDYRKAGYSKKFMELHREDILLHQAAKDAFDKLGLKKLPTIKFLRAEYAPMLEEKKKTYAEYRAVRDEMKSLLVAKSNVDRLLGNARSGHERNIGRPER